MFEMFSGEVKIVACKSPTAESGSSTLVSKVKGLSGPCRGLYDLLLKRVMNITSMWEEAPSSIDNVVGCVEIAYCLFFCY